jgi:hypothetical protein
MLSGDLGADATGGVRSSLFSSVRADPGFNLSLFRFF